MAQTTRAYLVLLSGFLMMFNCWGLITAYGAFMSLYDIHLLSATPNVLLALIGSSQAFVVLSLSPVVGRLLDAHKHYLLGYTGFVLITAGYLALSFTCEDGLRDQGTYWQIFLATMMAGLGQACTFTYSSQNAGSWFPGQRFLAIGITSAGAAAGGLIYPLAFKFLVSRFAFPNAVRILTAIIGSTSLLAAATGSPPQTPSRRVSAFHRISTWFDVNAFRNVSWVWYSASVSFIFAGFFSLPMYVTLWAADKSLGTVEDIVGGTGERKGDSGFRTFWFLSIMNACSLFGRVLSGWLAGKQAKYWPDPIMLNAISCVLLGLICLVWWPLASSTASAIAFSATYGTLGGAVLGIPASAVASLVPLEFMTSLGQWVGQMFALGSVSALVGPVIAGALYKRFGSVSVGLFAGSTLLGASLCQTMAWWTKTRSRVKEQKKRESDNPSNGGESC